MSRSGFTTVRGYRKKVGKIKTLMMCKSVGHLFSLLSGRTTRGATRFAVRFLSRGHTARSYTHTCEELLQLIRRIDTKKMWGKEKSIGR